MQHRKANEVAAVARGVMAEHHPLLDQRGPRIEWVFTRPESPSGKCPDFKIRKVSGLGAYLALSESEKPDRWGFPVSPFVAVEVSERFWGYLDEAQREAMCDHLLAHLTFDHDKGAWTVEGPEFGEFEGVLARRGFWRPDRRLRRFADRVAEQLSFADAEESAETPGEEVGDDEDLDVSITFGDKTVQTSTDRMRRLSEGLADGSVELGSNGEHVEAETGEILEPVGPGS